MISNVSLECSMIEVHEVWAVAVIDWHKPLVAFFQNSNACHVWHMYISTCDFLCTEESFDFVHHVVLTILPVIGRFVTVVDCHLWRPDTSTCSQLAEMTGHWST